MTSMNLRREDSPSPVLQQAKELLHRSSANNEIGQRQQTMPRASPSPITAASNASSSCDRNHIRGIVLTSRTPCSNAASTTTAGVIVATAETSRATATGANKKTIEAPSSFARKGFYATSSGGNVSTNRHATWTEPSANTRCGSDRSDVDEYGVWEPRQNDGVEKSASQDSIIVQANAHSADAVERSPSSEDDLVASTYSHSSAATVIKRFDQKSAVLIDQRTESENNMNDLPSYELASAYVKTNAYAQMSNSKGAAISSSNIPPVMAAAVTTHQPHSIATQGSHSYDKINQYDQSPGTPTTKLSIASSSSAVLSQQQRQSHLARESSLEPIGEEERLVQLTQAVMNSQVNYFGFSPKKF